MKKLYFSLFCCLPFLIMSQNITKILPDFDRTGMNTSILYNGAAISNITDYKTKTHNVYSFYQAYKAIAFSDFQQRLVSLDELKKSIKNQDEDVVISVLFSEFETFKPEVENMNIIRKTVDNTIERLNTSTPIFDTHEILIASPMEAKHKGLKLSFDFSSKFFFNTTNKSIEQILVNFDDGNDFVKVTFNSKVAVSYSGIGKKNLQFQFLLSDGTIRNTQSSITIDYSKQDLNDLYRRMITTYTSSNTAAPNLAPYGQMNYKGIGEYDIYMGNDGVLDKPIILVDGFDPSDTRNIQAIYDLLNFDNAGSQQNLGDVIRAEDFDIVVLNFPVYTRTEDGAMVDGGSDFIERNAMLLVELIGIINATKIGNEQNVIIGPSMGGLISRYALNFMENQSLTHDTRLWISFDAPHLGANVPLGFQHMFNYLAYGLDTWVGDFSVEALRPVVDGMLKSPAARQMLVDQFETHLINANSAEFNNTNPLPVPHPYFNTFFNSLNTLTSTGYPEQVRNVSMINGSGIGSPYFDNNGSPMLPGRAVLSTVIDDVAFLTDAHLDAWYTPLANVRSRISKIWIDAPFICFCDITSEAFSKSNTFSAGVDTASGGLFDLEELAADFAGTDPLIDSFLAALQTNYFNFIPSVSSMALQNDGEINWFHDINLGIPTGRFTVQNTTPFINWYMPDANENHITLTPANVQFALDEIMPQTLTIPSVGIEDRINIEKNPISNELTVLSNRNFENVSFRIVDMTGKVIYNNQMDLNSRTTIPLNIELGMYVLNIKTQDDISFQKKIIVK